MVSPQTRSPNAGVVSKNCVLRPLEKSPAVQLNRLNAENLYTSAKVVHLHDSVLAE